MIDSVKCFAEINGNTKDMITFLQCFSYVVDRVIQGMICGVTLTKSELTIVE